MSDQHIRQAALNPTESFIVQAPAGSGKTELLTQRYLILLSRAQKYPEEIIAITFTKKAAAEMRSRIIEALDFASENPAPDAHHYRYITWSLAQAVLKRDQELKWNLLDNPNRLRILTIDALANLICQQTPILNQLCGNHQINDDAQSLYILAANRTLQLATTDNTLRSCLEKLLLHVDNNTDNLIELFVDLLHHREQWLPNILHVHQQESVRALFEKSIQDIIAEKLTLARQSIPKEHLQNLQLLIHHAGNVLDTDAKNWYHNQTHSRDLPAWRELSAILLTTEGELRKTIDKRNGFEKEDPNKKLMMDLLKALRDYPDFQEQLYQIQQLPHIDSYRESDWSVLTSITQLLHLLAGNLSLIFQEKSQVDFTELNLAALRALGDSDSPTDLALYLDYRIQHILVDEFQDTSLTHFQLLEKITAGWQSDDGRTLFLVGDPMQSIYRFRNAEVGLFLRAQEQGIGKVALTPLTLTQNFRSQSGLIDWFNKTFSTLFPVVSDIATGRVPYTPALASKEKLSIPAVSFYTCLENEAEKITTEIDAIIKNYPDDSIAILVRNKKLSFSFIHSLRSKKIPYQAVEIDALSDQMEIRDLMSLTRALLHRADRIAWLSVLRSPFCGLSLSDLEILSQHAHRTVWESMQDEAALSAITTDGKKRVMALSSHLQNAFAKQGQLPLSSWVEGVWLSLQGPTILSDLSQMDYVKTFFNLLSTLNQDDFSVEKLTQLCQKQYSDIQCAQKNPVQILTIHKSKGLEFDHVFLIGLNKKTKGSDQKLLRWIDRVNYIQGCDLLFAPTDSVEKNKTEKSLYQYLSFLEKEKLHYESTRLLYVATTRAKKSLHLSAIIEKTIYKNSFLYQLKSFFEPAVFSEKSDEKKLETQEKKEEKTLLHRVQDIPFLNPVVHTPASVDIAMAYSPSRIIGTYVHEIFHQIAQSGDLSIENNLQPAKWRSRLITLGLLPYDLDHAIDAIQKAVSNTLSDKKGQWILSPHLNAHSESAFSFEKEGKIEQAIIDRSFVENDVRWIIDYKTASPTENELISDFLEKQKSEYTAQLEKYAALFAQEKRIVQLGLYFPMCQQWIEWRA